MDVTKHLPRPPAEIVRYTCGYDDADRYLQQGLDVYTMLDLAARKFDHQPLDSFSNILDFGCGAGRLLQFIPDGPSVTGVDVNRPVLSWAQANLARANYLLGTAEPPLPLTDGTFDLVYSFSVFSHLTRPQENRWLAELARLGSPECLYLITVHGDWMIQSTLGEARANAEQDGFYFKYVHSRKGDSSFDFPLGYEASYHTSAYIKSEWSNYLDVIAVIDGRNPADYLFDDLGFAPQGTVRPFRAMGQDLVVARKKPSQQV